MAAMLVGVLTGLLVLLGATAVASTPAAAAPYPPTVCAAIAVSTTTPHANQKITVSGTGFTAGDQVEIVLSGSVNKTLAHARIAADGTFRTEVTIPGGIKGHFKIEARGGGPSCPVDPILLDVRAGLGIGGVTAGPGGGGPSTNGTGGLAFTGLNALLLIAAAAALIATGVLLARGGRRRTHSSGW
jgi:hypothetical protein